MRKPTISKGPASSYASPDEIIREVSNGKCGFLLSIRNFDDGTLRVEIYRADSGVTVYAQPGIIGA